MPAEVGSLLPLVLAAAAAGLVGGIIPCVWKPSAFFRGHLQHFAGGILLAVIAVDLMPEVRERDAPVPMILGFVAGAIAMIALKRVTARIEARDDGDVPYGFIGAALIDTLVDGVLVGAGFVVDPRLGAFLVLGLGMELFTLTMAVTASMRKARVGIVWALSVCAGISSMLAIGAVGGAWLLAGRAPSSHTFVLSFAVVALLYLVTEELLVRGRRAEETAATAATFFTGFILLASYTAFAPG